MKLILLLGAVLCLWVALLGHSLEAVVFGVLGVVVGFPALRKRGEREQPKDEG